MTVKFVQRDLNYSKGSFLFSYYFTESFTMNIHLFTHELNHDMKGEVTKTDLVLILINFFITLPRFFKTVPHLHHINIKACRYIFASIVAVAAAKN